tara:strand:+ start:26343 stop:27626 length:1284 start_codon:yes stop_codon:yes gene_type:complete
MEYEEFFSNNNDIKDHSPLADILRPRELDDFYGQKSILDDDSLLRNAILNDKVNNLILTGPPGVGKTTLVGIISNCSRSNLISLNAVFSGIKELRNSIQLAEERLLKTKRKTILFIDEVHRFTSAQQDALLSSIENGTITFIGATTENPYFSINQALLSRSRIFKLVALNRQELMKIIQKVIKYFTQIENPKQIVITKDAQDHLINFSNGDARTLINSLEYAINIASPEKDNLITINLSIAEDSIQNKKIIYDKKGQNHFDIISAFIKSIRGSDPDATLFWLANMIAAGEDPKYIFRRLLISASEDIGLADPNAIVVVNSCSDAFYKVGDPEGNFFLAQASLYLALSRKSNSVKAITDFIHDLESYDLFSVPDYLRNNSKTYINPHKSPKEAFKQNYMPANINLENIWRPSLNGWERLKYDELKEMF